MRTLTCSKYKQLSLLQHFPYAIIPNPEGNLGMWLNLLANNFLPDEQPFNMSICGFKDFSSHFHIRAELFFMLFCFFFPPQDNLVVGKPKEPTTTIIFFCQTKWSAQRPKSHSSLSLAVLSTQSQNQNLWTCARFVSNVLPALLALQAAQVQIYLVVLLLYGSRSWLKLRRHVATESVFTRIQSPNLLIHRQQQVNLKERREK